MPSSLPHTCTVVKPNANVALFGFKKSCAKLRTIFLISRNNPLNVKYFRSERSLEAEKRRQVELKCTTVIHPLSNFRMWYDCYLIFIYLLNLLSKPIDCAFATSRYQIYPGYNAVSTVLDFACWVDILVNFNTGIILETTKKVELRRSRIAKHYINSPYFICDFLSSTPINMVYFFNIQPPRITAGVVRLLGLMKIVRIFSVVSIVNRVSSYFHVKNRTHRFLFNSLLIMSLLVHWLSCMQFIVPRITGRLFADPNRPYDTRSWIYSHGIYYKPWTVKYSHCFFKGSAEILGMRLDMYPINITADYIVSIATYWIGKIIIGSTWIVLAVTMLNARSMELKFYEIINQLDEYMAQKQLPLNLRQKISKYYDFKYQRLFFKEQMITNLLSKNLKREVNIHVCKSLISSVKLFADMPQEQVSLVVARLIPEIFLPRDTIMQSGSTTEAMYFIASGTVVMYSRSGKEICHLQEGAYFGEVGMVMKNQQAIATVIALEITQVYRMKKRDFELCLMKDKRIFDKLVAGAEIWMKTIVKVEEEYKKRLFEQMYNTTGSTTGLQKLEEFEEFSESEAQDKDGAWDGPNES